MKGKGGMGPKGGGKGFTGAGAKSSGPGLKDYPKDCKVWVGNLPQGFPKDTLEESLKEHLALAGGTVVFACVMKGTTGGVAFETAEQASDAIAQLNGTMLGESEIQVDVWTGA